MLPAALALQKGNIQIVIEDPPDYFGFAPAAPQSCKDPTSYDSAMASPYAVEWKKPIDDELGALKEKKAWKLMQLPKGRKALGSKFASKAKRLADGSFERLKARLVIQGLMQREGFDYSETSAPAADFTAARVALTIAAAFDMDAHQLDVASAFLNGELDEEARMKQPRGFEEPGKENLACRLLKSLHGLKQAPRAWL
eukprot:Plantae.Rhodophyta-Hildenbrandia_rubra.ctg8727.p3 GENE.Plantae.Rhodophyta-Hildenbrandia_rubra.ctg8727~~Plantae.Rhodophyta-Hildenbrandia_rubra.ctg8727.p3  ORF type:complete len:198 (-),score=48.30 Plantae.Rhodophyta-Hildenbrandia_rubra.ctg8727:1025-1618(-)